MNFWILCWTAVKVHLGLRIWRLNNSDQIVMVSEMRRFQEFIHFFQKNLIWLNDSKTWISEADGNIVSRCSIWLLKAFQLPRYNVFFCDVSKFLKVWINCFFFEIYNTIEWCSQGTLRGCKSALQIWLLNFFRLSKHDVFMRFQKFQEIWINKYYFRITNSLEWCSHGTPRGSKCGQKFLKFNFFQKMLLFKFSVDSNFLNHIWIRNLWWFHQRWTYICPVSMKWKFCHFLSGILLKISICIVKLYLIFERFVRMMLLWELLLTVLLWGPDLQTSFRIVQRFDVLFLFFLR